MVYWVNKQNSNSARASVFWVNILTRLKQAWQSFTQSLVIVTCSLPSSTSSLLKLWNVTARASYLSVHPKTPPARCNHEFQTSGLRFHYGFKICLRISVKKIDIIFIKNKTQAAVINNASFRTFIYSLVIYFNGHLRSLLKMYVE